MCVSCVCAFVCARQTSRPEPVTAYVLRRQFSVVAGRSDRSRRYQNNNKNKNVIAARSPGPRSSRDSSKKIILARPSRSVGRLPSFHDSRPMPPPVQLCPIAHALRQSFRFVYRKQTNLTASDNNATAATVGGTITCRRKSSFTQQQNIKTTTSEIRYFYCHLFVMETTRF